MAVDPVTHALWMKGALCFGLLAAGFVTLLFGRHVYRDRASNGRSRILIEIGNFKVTAHGAGAVIMAAAVGWGMLAVRASPNLKIGNGVTEVYAFNTVDGSVQVPAITGFELRPGTYAAMALDADSLVSSFSAAAQHEGVVVTATKIEGQPAKFVLSEVTAVRAGASYVLRVPLDSGTKSAVVEFQPVFNDRAFSFQPTSARVLSNPGSLPTPP